MKRRRFRKTRQAAPAVPAPSPREGRRRGLAARYFGALAQRRLVAALTAPVAVPLVAVAVCAVLAAVALGAVVGALLLAGHDGGDW